MKSQILNLLNIFSLFFTPGGCLPEDDVVPGWQQVGVGYFHEREGLTQKEMNMGSLGGYCIVEKKCIDINARCNTVCVCKDGFVPLYIDTIPEAKRGSLMCFVEPGEPCQPDLIEVMVPDTEKVLTVPGKLQDMINKNKAAVTAFEAGPNNDQYVLIGEYKRRIRAFEAYLLKYGDIIGRSKEHWSCGSGNCTDGKCLPGMSPLIENITFTIVIPPPATASLNTCSWITQAIIIAYSLISPLRVFS